MDGYWMGIGWDVSLLRGIHIRMWAMENIGHRDEYNLFTDANFGWTGDAVNTDIYSYLTVHTPKNK